MADADPRPAKRARTDDADCESAVYLGEEGSLAHIAATQFFKSHPQTRLVGVGSFSGVFDTVVGGEALYGVVPIENSASGSLHATYDLLAKHDVVICGELGVRETYCLCTRPGASLAAVRRVLSHPRILEACSTFIETQLKGRAAADASIEEVAMTSTTEAARRVAEATDGAVVAAAIATKEAAHRHGLVVLAEDIGNDAFLETRYVLVHRRTGPAAGRPSPFPRDALSPIRKRSACFALSNEPGAIFKLLSCWALRGINVMKVETRPWAAGHRAPPGLPSGTARLWDYLFFVDYTDPPGQTEEANTRLWEALSEFSLWQRDFGTYPSLTSRAEKQPQTWAEMVDIMAKA